MGQQTSQRYHTSGSVPLALLWGLELLKNSVSIGYSPVGPMGVSPTGPEPGDVEVSPGSSHKIGMPHQGVNSVLGDTDYYTLTRPGMQALWPLEPGEQEASLRRQLQKSGHQTL